jgi:hypothetical protein
MAKMPVGLRTGCVGGLPTDAYSSPSSSSSARPSRTLAEGRLQANNQTVTLLAHSPRRAFGTLLVLLGVIWLIQVGVYHITLPPLRGNTIFPDGVEARIRAQPALAAE